MNVLEFSNEIPADELATIFKDFFEQHMVAYNILSKIRFVSLNEVTCNKSSIIYSVKLLEDEDKEKLVNNLNNIPVTMYGKQYIPNVFLNGDLLCITIEK